MPQKRDWAPPRLKVLPNPWLLVHPTKGPIAACMVDLAGREDVRLTWVGAKRVETVLEDRLPTDPRGRRVFGEFEFPALASDLLSGTPVEVPDTGYYRQQLEQGALVPADTFTASVKPAPLFADLAAAKAAGIAKLESEHPGRWPLLAAHFGFEVGAKATKKPEANEGGTGGGEPTSGSKGGKV